MSDGITGGNVYAVDERTAAPRLTQEALEPLVDRARAGDADAFETLVRALQGPVRAFTRRMMRDPHLGDDAAQETFVRLWRGLPGYRPSGRFIGWVFTVARNTCIEHLRKESRTPVPSEVLPEPEDRSVEDVRAAVAHAIHELGEPYRSTLLLREEGLSYDEIGGIMHCPVGTVRSRLHTAKRMLALRLAPFLAGGDHG